MAQSNIRGISCTNAGVALIVESQSPMALARWKISSVKDIEGQLAFIFDKDLTAPRFAEQKDGAFRWTRQIDKGTEHLPKFNLTRPAKVEFVGESVHILLPKKLNAFVPRQRRERPIADTPKAQETSATSLPDLVRELNAHKRMMGDALTFRVNEEGLVVAMIELQ